MRRLLGAIPTVLLSTVLLLGFDEPPPAAPLFDGKSLEGWVAEHGDGFVVRDEVLTSKPGSGWLRTAKAYKNFQLDLEFRILKEGSEGGLFFRTNPESAPAEPFWPARGYQIPLADGEGRLMLFGHGTNPPRFERKADALKTAAKEPGAWQKLSLKAIGPHVEVSLNDVLVTVADDVDPAGGHLGLYDKTGPYEWKNLTIRVQPD
ncbi:3-keto-disaccharide hydrolase [Paludisphaera mucosa]|uniref:DUF1080 domain-containing protein n=1 Tax=Paludisphaera mucosa TaxID=3030827 RepID=A0ABT6F588_9BACT|nr:DUF1080 domain-containing protein [Paludisphaera mucosa]MDG3002753.1 DUF1080 domain-containing protein [Paludisphaera mucosa]